MGTIRLVAGMLKQHYTASTLFLMRVYLWLYHIGMYLIVITRKRNVGSLLGHAVWKAMDFDVISYKKTVLHLSEIQVSGKPFSLYSICIF